MRLNERLMGHQLAVRGYRTLLGISIFSLGSGVMSSCSNPDVASTTNDRSSRNRCRPRRWPATTTLIVGAVCAFGGLMLFAVVGFAGFGNHIYRAPVTVVLECHVGDYYIYQHVGSQAGFPTLKPYQVQVRGPDSANVATFSTESSDTITRGSWTYLNTVGFHAGISGNYEVRIAAVSPPSVIVAPSVGSQYVRAAPWLILVGLGGLVGVAGLVSLVRRGRERVFLGTSRDHRIRGLLRQTSRNEPGPTATWFADIERRVRTLQHSIRKLHPSDLR